MPLRNALTSPARYASLLAGALPAFAFPAPNLELLGWVGLVPGMLLMRRAPSAREAAVRGWLFGAGFLLAAVYWLAPEVGPALLLIAFGLGVLLAPFGVAVWGLLRPPVTAARSVAALVVLPSYWLLAEWARSWQTFGGPWDVLGASQWQHPAVLALAALGGMWLISFVLVVVNVAIVLLLVARSVVPGLAAVAVGGAAVAAGPVAFALTPPAPVTGHVTIALIQPGMVRNPPLRDPASEQLTAALLRSDGGNRPRPDLIVWGESSVGFYVRQDRALLGGVTALAAKGGAQLLINQDALHDGRKSKVAVLVGAGGIDGTYTKSRLVPFGEYIPLRSALSWLTSVSRAAPVNMTAGHGAHVLRMTLPGGRRLTIGPLICFESAFPDMSRFDTDHGAHVIIYQTADSTFQGTWELAQHAALGAVRAAETGRPVVEAALTGDTAAFDARGRQLAWMDQSQRGVTMVRLSLPAASARTPYDRLGDYVPWAAVAVAALTALIALVRRLADMRGKGGVGGGHAAQWKPASGLNVPG